MATGASAPSALPRPPTKISEALAKYRTHDHLDARRRVVEEKKAAENWKSSVAGVGPGSSGRALAGTMGTYRGRMALGEEPGSGSAVPRLTDLALRAIAAHFEDSPDIDGLDPKFSLAITSSLPTKLDIGVTALHVHDEHYWKRVCLEEKKWMNCRIEEHGMSWKQLFFERNLQEELETFGVFANVTRAHEDALVRPPIDSTHPLWKTLYPKVLPLRVDGKPTRERFCRFGPDCQAVRVARAPNSGWPALERLKPLVVPGVEEFGPQHAWASLDPIAAWGPPEGEEGGAGATAATASTPAAGGAGSGGGGGGGGGAAAAAGGGGRKPAGAAAAGTLPSAPSGLSPSVALASKEKPTDRAPDGVADTTAAPERECDGNVLREYVSPEALNEFKLTGRWPEARGPCLLCLRAEQLSRLAYHIEASEDFVFALHCEQLPSHLDLEIPFARLPNLSVLQLSYGMQHVGMKYDRALLGMKISDAMSLAKCVKATQTLTSLILPCNLIDDDLLRMLMTGLVHNQTVTHLDVSHNKITAQGVRLLCKALGPGSVLMSLDLSDNQIHSEGGKYLGRALKKNESLIDLNLRLNRLEDEGGRLLLDGVLQSKTLTSLNVASNRLGDKSAEVLAAILAEPTASLMTVDLSGNLLGEGEAAAIQEAMRENASLTALDLRGNAGLHPESAALDAIHRITRRNELSLRSLMRST